MVNELSKQQRKILLMLVAAILLGAGRLGFRAFSRGTLEVHLVEPVTVAWPDAAPDGRAPEFTQPVLALSAGGTAGETDQTTDSPTPPGEEQANLAEKDGPPPTGGPAGNETSIKRLDPNTATSEELQTLPGIGPVLAARIIEYRETVGKFRTIDDLLAVKGIGEKTLMKIRPYLEIKE
ncbi:MAG: helix-hairpin-helix domain-containing protein [Firmicutes bacterium]|nr:helix-hairpin-helix domain-containing protein [Bacillota bacterium]